MSKVVLDMSVSLDGIGAGPNPSAEHPMGTGGERLHAWMPFYAPEQELTSLSTRSARLSPTVDPR